jgi:hypothetical protein
VPSAPETSLVPFAGDPALADGDAGRALEVGALEVGALEVAAVASLLAAVLGADPLGCVGSEPPEHPARRPRTTADTTAALGRMGAP